jgi:hypothetical protein
MLMQWQVPMNDDVVILKQLDELREQHRKLDTEISQLMGSDQEFRLAQLKKQKLRMRDQISTLEMEMFPDQPA